MLMCLKQIPETVEWKHEAELNLLFSDLLDVWRVYFMFTAHYTVYVEALQVSTWHHNELVHIITELSRGEFSDGADELQSTTSDRQQSPSITDHHWRPRGWELMNWVQVVSADGGLQ